ncbi:nitrite/sulfite reductase [Bacillus sp. AGMB 02131]|uniref:Nitrite/sulfite reductase n=1 Tax=Peribacillus faecalis TaxID=2772559 RepID=A0A927HAW0_9BACI|nr:nitrite/sulfite reductase [Peribacillus faecalis]MBD3107947.1 nitrite/sulfite reductase [Peribacillus faecalis]
MAYVKHWADNEKLNKTELSKLEKDGLRILDDIPQYAKDGFESIPQDQWDLFKWAGLYLQKPKEAGYFMMRVNVPSGILTKPQVEALAGIARDYGRGVFDITTRQAVQFHWLTIDQVPDIFNRLEAVGLSSAGACGDITRTIVGNPIAGLDPDELFDTAPIVKEVYDFFQRNEDFSNLPRKYKVSISANLRNASNAEINCLSFTPAVKEIDGELKKGFHVKVGGGLSSRPFLAQTLDAFVEPERTLEVAIAITTIFRDYGYREKRHQARLKFLVADWGPEKFLEKITELIGPLPTKGEEPVQEWNAGYFYGVHDQKQEGLKFLGFNVPVGRLDADEVFELARISGKYGNGEIRTCNSQNLIIPNIPTENVEALLAEPIFKRITINPNSFLGHSVACTGIEYCNLALVETKERMRVIAEELDQRIELDVPVRMHMVGCPNSCGQRQIADIGLQGMKMRNHEKKMVEAYEIYVGGTLNAGGKFNEKLKGKVPAEQLTNVLEKLLIHFKSEKAAGESYFDFVHRLGLPAIQEVYDGILEQVVNGVSL